MKACNTWQSVCCGFGLLVLSCAVVGNESAVGLSAQQELLNTCTACHNLDGNSTLDIYPKIAGQGAGYMAKQLRAFRAGSELGRYNAVMLGMAGNLDDEDIAFLAAYYSEQDMAPLVSPQDVIEPGGALYRGGDLSRGLSACTACHGPRGNGLRLAKFPKLSHQHPSYTKAQLELFKAAYLEPELIGSEQARANDPNGMMREISSKLTPKEMELLAQFLAGLH